VVVVVFSIRNWIPVTINLFGDLQADVKLPVLLMIAFLIGFVPLYIWHHAWRWRDRRRRTAEQVGTVQPIATPEPVSYQPTTPGFGTAQAD
jgi:putative flippase GtrA